MIFTNDFSNSDSGPDDTRSYTLLGEQTSHIIHVILSQSTYDDWIFFLTKGTGTVLPITS